MEGDLLFDRSFHVIIVSLMSILLLTLGILAYLAYDNFSEKDTAAEKGAISMIKNALFGDKKEQESNAFHGAGISSDEEDDSDSAISDYEDYHTESPSYYEDLDDDSEYDVDEDSDGEIENPDDESPEHDNETNETETVASKEIVLYLSPEGNDQWSGKLSEPNHEKNDGPFATIEKAMDYIRSINENRDIIVYLREGTYFLNTTLYFNYYDSGKDSSKIKYISYKDEKPVLSGGFLVKGWKKDSQNLWSAEIPDVKNGKVYFTQLFVNGERRERARTPNSGEYFYVKSVVDKKNSFAYEDIDIDSWLEVKSNWDNQDVGIMVKMYHWWATSRHYIHSIDVVSKNVILSPSMLMSETSPDIFPIISKQRYYIENVFSGLDEPGEWYLNAKTGIIYYYPYEGENMNEAEVIAPVLRNLVAFNGNPEQGKYVENIVFDGISFQHSDAYFSTDMNCGQHACKQDAAITAIGLRNSEIKNCEISHIGEGAIWLRKGSRHNTVSRCNIYDIGASGIRIGDFDIAADSSIAAGSNIIDNNFIHDIGNVFEEGTGIVVPLSSNNVISHNEICNLDYTGISIGWTYNYDLNPAEGNNVEYNSIHNLGRGVMSDMGGIYVWYAPKTKVSNNIIHDIDHYNLNINGQSTYGYGAWGLYADFCSADSTFENNIVYNVESNGLHKNYCTSAKNTIKNNIFAFSNEEALLRHYDKISDNAPAFDFENNIIYQESNGTMIAGDLVDQGKKVGLYTMDKNIYWVTNTNKKMYFDGKTFDEWNFIGNDQGSITSDPMFVDAKNADFRLKQNSPAIELGFKQIDQEKIGLYGDDNWKDMPNQYCDK